MPAEDRHLLAQRSCTSKLRTFQALLTEHRAFGFRGEALASLSEVSAELVITTRTVRDAVGEEITLATGGRIVRRVARACPCGTTVRVARLFEPFPVRRRVAAAPARRTAEDLAVQQLCVEYGLARPGVRIQLRSPHAVPPRTWAKPAAADVGAAVSICLGVRVHLALCPVRWSGSLQAPSMLDPPPTAVAADGDPRAALALSDSSAASQISGGAGGAVVAGGEEPARGPADASLSETPPDVESVPVTIHGMLPRPAADFFDATRSRPDMFFVFVNERCGAAGPGVLGERGGGGAALRRLGRRFAAIGATVMVQRPPCQRQHRH